MDKREKFLIKSLKDLWMTISWLDFNKKAKLARYFQTSLNNCDPLLEDLHGLILEEQCQFFEQVTRYYIKSAQGLAQTDFLGSESQSSELNETKARIQDIGDQFTEVLKKFTIFCDEELKNMHPDCTPSSLLLIFLEIILSQGDSKKRYMPSRIKILGHGLFPETSLYAGLEFAANNATLDRRSFSSSGFPESLGFMLASRVLSNIEEKEANPPNLAMLKSSLYGRFFSFCSSLLGSFFLSTCFNFHSLASLNSSQKDSHSMGGLSRLGQHSEEHFLKGFFGRHDKLLFTHEDKTNLLLVNFISSILFVLNSISVVGQIKQKVSKTLLIDESASETDKLIARQTLLFEQISKNVSIFTFLLSAKMKL